MYINFWPTPGPNNAASASSPMLPPNSMSVIPQAQIDAANARKLAIGTAAAKAYQAAQTTGPGMDYTFLNSAGGGTVSREDVARDLAQTCGPAPSVVPLNNPWAAPVFPNACGGSTYEGMPWGDAALYSPAPGAKTSAVDWIAQHPIEALLLAALGGLGLYSLGGKK